MSKNFKTPSWSSPRTKGRGCLCPDDTYSRKCCNGNLEAQGIGSLTGQGEGTIVHLP